MRLKISQKLSIIFCLLLIITIGILSFFAYKTFTSQIFQEIENQLTISVTHTMQMIDRVLFERVSDMALLTSQKNMALVIDDETINVENFKDKVEYLRDIEINRKVYGSISIYDSKGIKLGDTRGLYIGIDESAKPFFKAAIQGNIYWDSKPFMSQSLGLPVIHFSGPLKDVHGNIKGVLVARFPIGKLHDILKSTMGNEHAIDIEVDLLDSDGLILFSDHDRADILKQKFGNLAMIQKAMAGDNKDVFSVASQDNGQEKLFVVAKQKGYLDFKGNGWILVVSVKTDLLFKQVYDLIWEFILVGLVLSGMIIPLIIFFAQAISKPLIELTKKTVEIGKGNLNQSIDIKTNDEFGELSEAFNLMVRNLKNVTASRADLQKVHEKLKETQLQLLQSEKLASIGQLAAGVAHEINNPVGFISNNMEVLGQYIADYGKILRMVDNLKVAIEQEDWGKSKLIVQDMTKFEQEINLDYIVNDINNLLQHNQRGIERIQKIVLDLRTFAREDKDTMDLIKIEEVIDSILSIVHNELKYKAELKKSYGETPLIKCNSQRLGQVFINLFVNAGQAIEEKGTIEVKTYTKEKFVCIDIIDTGKGIPEENLKKVFDAFFTTKPIGQGTGLGLSVSYEIVKKHGGEIKVQSKVGEGTIFTVMLPVV